MNAEFFKIVGQVAGIGGIAIGAFLFLFRDIIRKNIFPNLTKDQAYNLLRLISFLVWSVAIAGIIAWVLTYTITSADKNGRDTQPLPSQNKNYSSTKYEIAGQVRDEMGGLSGADILDVNS